MASVHVDRICCAAKWFDSRSSNFPRIAHIIGAGGFLHCMNTKIIRTSLESIMSKSLQKNNGCWGLYKSFETLFNQPLWLYWVWCEEGTDICTYFLDWKGCTQYCQVLWASKKLWNIAEIIKPKLFQIGRLEFSNFFEIIFFLNW